jgi:hypothetical protein
VVPRTAGAAAFSVRARELFHFLDHYEPPALAKALGTIGRFWLAHWKWIIGTAIAMVALWLR